MTLAETCRKRTGSLFECIVRLNLIRENVLKVGGEEAWRFAELRFEELYALADGKISMPREKYYDKDLK